MHKPEDVDILPANTREEQITATGQGAKGDEGSLEIVRALWRGQPDVRLLMEFLLLIG